MYLLCAASACSTAQHQHKLLELGSTEAAAVGCLDCCRTVQQPLQLMQQQTGVLHCCSWWLNFDKHTVQAVLLHAFSFACIVLEICSCSRASLMCCPVCSVVCSNGAAEQSDAEQLLSPLDRARQALEADPIDATLMVSC